MRRHPYLTIENMSECNDSVRSAEREYSVGDTVIYNASFAKGHLEMVVCKVTAKYSNPFSGCTEYDLEAVDEYRRFACVTPAYIFTDKYELHLFFDSAVEFLLSEMDMAKNGEQ